MPKTGADESDPVGVQSSNRVASSPTFAAGANNGTTPPAPTAVAGSSDLKGKVQFGSGTTPAAGAQVVVTFSQAYRTAPVSVMLTGGNAGTDALGALDAQSITATGFTIGCQTAPTASQGGTVYVVEYEVIEF